MTTPINTNTNSLLFTARARAELDRDYKEWLAKGNKPEILPVGAVSEQEPAPKKRGRGSGIVISGNGNAR